MSLFSSDILLLLLGCPDYSMGGVSQSNSGQSRLRSSFWISSCPDEVSPISRLRFSIISSRAFACSTASRPLDSCESGTSWEADRNSPAVPVYRQAPCPSLCRLLPSSGAPIYELIFMFAVGFFHLLDNYRNYDPIFRDRLFKSDEVFVFEEMGTAGFCMLAVTWRGQSILACYRVKT